MPAPRRARDDTPSGACVEEDKQAVVRLPCDAKGRACSGLGLGIGLGLGLGLGIGLAMPKGAPSSALEPMLRKGTRAEHWSWIS